jgi:hypothetical protein
VRSVLAFLAWLMLTPVVFITADVAAHSATWGVVATGLWWAGGALAGSLVQGRVEAGQVAPPQALNDERLRG